MKKRLVSMLVAVGMAAGLLSGCGSTSAISSSAVSGGGSSAVSTAAASGSTASDAGSSGGEVKLTLIHNMVEDTAINWLNQVIDQYTEAHPNVTIDMETLSSDDYDSMLRSKIAADDVPDIFFLNDISQQHEYIESGICRDLSDQAWLTENVQESAVNAVTEDGKTWCLPMFVSGMFVTYNKDVFEECGISDVPTTWTEFIDDCKKIKDSGKAAIAGGFQEQWCLFSDETCDSIVTTLKNDPDNRLELAAGTTTWQDDKGKFSEVLQRFRDRFPYYNDDPFGTDSNTMYNMVATGDAAMLLNGSWAPASILGINPDANIGIFGLPLTDDPADAKIAMHASPGGFAVYKDSPNADEAVKFLEFLSTPEMGVLEEEVKGDVSANKNVEVNQDNQIMSDIQKYYDDDMVFDWTGYSELFTSDELELILTDTITDFLMDDSMSVDDALKQLDEKFSAALSAQK